MRSGDSAFIWLLVIIAVLMVTLIILGRRQLRILGTHHSLEFDAPPGHILGAAAGALKGFTWTVSQTPDGLSARHSSGSVLSVELSDQSTVEVYYSNIRYFTQFAGIVKYPKPYGSLKRKRNKVMTAIATAAARDDWTVYQGVG